MAAQLPLYIDTNNDFCQFLSGDYLPITSGGTGATTQAGAVSALGLTIGTNTQAYSASLTALAALASTGLVVQTGANTFTDVTITGTSSNIVVTNGTGVGGNPTINLATVTNGGGGSFVKLSSDTYGRITGTSAVVAGDITGLITGTYLPIGGGTLTGNLILNADPTVALGAATKQYVDNNIQGLSPKQTAYVATTGVLPTNTYNNGTAGVGATLTATANALLTIDGVAMVAGYVVLVKNESTQANNGLYVVTNPGSAGAAYVLTRHVDMNQSGDFSGAFVPVGNAGTANANSLWLANPGVSVTVGTTAIPFTQLNGATDLTAGNSINITGNTINVTTVSSGRITTSGSGLDLATTGVTGGTYTSLTVDTYGRVTAAGTASPATIGAQPASTNLTALAGASATGGIWTVTGSGTGTEVTITGNSGRVVVTNGSGVAGNPTIDLASGVISTPGTYNSVTVDTYGRVTAGSTIANTTAVVQQALTNNQGSTINICQAVYSDSSGTVKLAQANASGTRLAVGFVLDTSINASSSGNIAVDGVITATTTQWNAVTGGSSGLTAGAKYWLSTSTPGANTSTAPTTNWLVFMGKALSTTQMQIGAGTMPIRLT